MVRRRAAHTASRYCQAADVCCGFESDPESKEWSEGEGEEDAVAGSDAGCPIDAVPVADHPIPTLGRIEPAHGSASGSCAGLAETGVAIDRISQVGAVGRMGLLVFD